ncbi:MAG: SurA N-terminal domain-containing protein [Pseudomonadota bacterium]
MKLRAAFRRTLIVLAAWPIGAAAQSFEIAAVVNDDAISAFDVELRATLIAQTGEAPARTSAERDLIRARALNELIDGALKRQEAERLGVQTTAANVDAALRDIARSNGVTREELRSDLGGDNGPYGSLRRRIEADIAWIISVSRQFGADATVSEAELDAAEAAADPSLRSVARETAVTLRQIFVPTEGNDAISLASARALADEARALAASCRDVDATHERLGLENLSELGEMRVEELPDDIRRVVERLPIDQPSRPIRLRTGYTVLFVCDRDFRSETAVDRDALAEQLRQRRLESLADRRLRDLRRTAVIDIR